ncbi:MAG: glycosyltransferase [Candidatus Margulisiibacteriota bacterium]|jgi:cellulose synthase/poly-beta-1,6-N-acetylglucosamine synthase-like glycosyltransferase
MSNEPNVSIIIPVRNADRTIDVMFQYLEDIDYPKDKLEIIIADGDSTDKTVQITKDWQKKYANIKLTQIPNCKSPGQARNSALKIVTGQYVLFTDGDCAPEKDWVRKIIAPFFLDPKIGGVGGEVLTLKVDPNNLTESYCEQVRFLSPTGRCRVKDNGYMPTNEHDFPHEVNGGDDSPFYATANVAFSKEAIDRIGGEFWHEPTGEDVDFSLRVLAAGYKIYYAKDAVVKHMHRVDLKSFCKQWFGYGFGHPLLLAKHAKPNNFEIVLQGKRPVYINIPWFGKGIVHLGTFHWMWIFGFWTTVELISALFTHEYFWVTLFALLTAWQVLRYLSPVRKLVPKEAFWTFAKVRYATNWSFMKGAIAGMRKFGTICIEPSW